MKVVHLTAHMSGGLARVLLSTLKHSREVAPEIQRKIVCLGQITRTTEQLFSDYKQDIVVAPTTDTITELLTAADVLQIEWWNHPLIYDFLIRCNLPPSRILVVCHVSGLNRPQILTKGIVRLADVFVGATKATSQHPLFSGESNEQFVKKLHFVEFPIDTESLSGIKNLDSSIFNIGYVGTVSYAKMHRQFLRICSKIDIDNAKFTVVGADDVDNIESESKQYTSTRFVFTGYQENVGSFLEKMDVFGYPLNPTHFGSGELVILEAMYFGIPVVAFSNKAESNIIRNGVTGLLVNSEDEYVNSIKYLYHNESQRHRIGKNAREFARNFCAGNTAMDIIRKLYDDLSQGSKKPKTYSKELLQLVNGQPDEIYGASLFIQSLGDTGIEFESSIFGSTAEVIAEADKKISNIEIAMKTKTKGSLFQYLYFFPNDPYLNLWAGLVRQQEGDDVNAVSYLRMARSYPDVAPRAKKYLEISERKIP